MILSHSDALLLFGAAADPTHKMIFPALYALAKKKRTQGPGARRRRPEVESR